jgi:hypothetical protein
MTELEKMQRAKQYIEKLASGIDPITNKEVPNDSALNNVRLSRCFFYVADILNQVIENGGKVSRTTINKKLPLELDWDVVRHIPVSEEPIYISRFTEKINDLIDNENMQGLRPVTITKWLVEKGFLKEETSTDGKKRKSPTEKGMQVGITGGMHNGQYGSYMAVFYNQGAQRFLLDNLKEIVEASNV